MIYKIIKEIPNHIIGEIMYLVIVEDKKFYEFVENTNYLLPSDVVENSPDFFEEIKIDWVIGEKIFYINSIGDIIQHLFNPMTHYKYISVKNAFKNKEDVETVLNSFKKLLNDDIIICNKENIFQIKELLMSKDKLKLEKINHLIDIILK